MYFKTLFLIFLWCGAFFSTFSANAAVTVDSTSNTADFTLGGVRNSPLTFQHTIAGAGEVLYVGVSNNRTLTATPTQLGCPEALPTAATGTVTALNYGGRMDFERFTTQTTNLNAVLSPNGCASVEVFRLKNPPTGTNTLSVTIPTGGDYVVIGAISFIGADSSTATQGALVPAAGASANPTVVVPTPTNGLVLDVIAAEYNSLDIIPDASQTRRWRLLNDPTPPPAFYVGAGSTESANGGSSVTMSWTLNSPGNWAIGGVFVKESVSAAMVSVGGRVTTRTGRGVGRVQITMTNSSGETRTATTNPFGYFYFENVAAGDVYVFSINSKRFFFAPQSIFIGEERGDLNFVAGQ
jgi:hypothetical protein